MHLDVDIPNMMTGNHHLFSIIQWKSKQTLYIIDLSPQISVMTIQDLFIIWGSKIGTEHGQLMSPSFLLNMLPIAYSFNAPYLTKDQ